MILALSDFPTSKSTCLLKAGEQAESTVESVVELISRMPRSVVVTGLVEVLVLIFAVRCSKEFVRAESPP
jgi:heme/copper-type cytochrome/quinol oxidase subunit 2